VTEPEYVRIARQLAIAAHAGQVDKAGQTYVSHPLRVGDTFLGLYAKEPDEAAMCQAAGYLHDVLEDTEMTSRVLAAAGIPEDVIRIVEDVTRRPHEEPNDYYRRIAQGHHLSHRVKAADIADNANPERLAMLSDATRQRLERKYSLARTKLGTYWAERVLEGNDAPA
jgi:(p)ppGpp synthase/HD superfamily hydrolase